MDELKSKAAGLQDKLADMYAGFKTIDQQVPYWQSKFGVAGTPNNKNGPFLLFGVGAPGIF